MKQRSRSGLRKVMHPFTVRMDALPMYGHCLWWGPKFFNLYFGYFTNVIKVLKMVLFAGDTNIFCSGDDLQHLLDEMTNEIIKVKFWLKNNK